LLLARNKYAVNSGKEELTINIHSRQKKQNATTGRLQRGLMVIIILGAFLLGILLTAQYAKIASASFKVVQLKQEIASLETANQRLYLRTLQLQSLERIEELAVAKLGMVYAEPREKQQLAILTSPSTGLVEAETSGIQGKSNVILVEQQGRQLNPVIQAISQIINFR
jgi:cell division protein FtsB